MSEPNQPDNTVEQIKNLVVLKNEGSEAHLVVVEPWANEYCLEPGKRLSVLFQHPKSDERVQIQFSEIGKRTVLCGMVGSTYQEYEADLSVDPSPTGFPAIDASVRMRCLEIFVGCK